MHKYRYIKFGGDVPPDIEHEYNRMCRREQYQEEADFIHGIVHLKNDGLLQSLVDETTLPEYEHERESDQIRQRRRELLPSALKWLSVTYPDEHKLILEYYYSAERITVNALAIEYNVSHQTISKRLTAARAHLRKYIILHESAC